MADTEFRRGKWWNKILTFTDVLASGPYTLTTEEIWVTLKRHHGDKDPVFRATRSGGHITITGANTAQLSVGPPMTDIPERDYQMEVQIQLAGWPGPITTQYETRTVLARVEDETL